MGPSFAGLIAVTVIAFFTPPEPSLGTSFTALSNRFFAAYHVGFGAMGVVLTALLADRLARAFGFNRPLAWIVSLGAFASGLKWPLADDLAVELGAISSTSILLGLVTTLATGEAFRFARKYVRGAIAADTAGAFAVAIVFGGLALVHVTLGDVLLTVIRPLVSASDTLPGLLLVVFFQTLLWTAGVHGPAFLSGIVTPVFLKALDENSQAVAAHQAPPHIVTIMLSIFYFPGGSGATLPLTLVMLRSRVARLRKLAIASILPTVWNVNETIIFGVPLVMNPSLTIPFLLVPLVLATITYLATWLNLVGHTIVYLPPVFPSFVTAWLTTAGDWRAIVLVFINIAIGAIIYAPFFRAYEKAIVAQPSEQNRLLREAEAIREQERDKEMHPERSTQ
ncbi:MAG TPA: PTS transporter subunit EIIC [Candidatus Eremiobacteraceae bacterium]|jgi:PTS system cellobiose-specific IIC component